MVLLCKINPSSCVIDKKISKLNTRSSWGKEKCSRWDIEPRTDGEVEHVSSLKQRKDSQSLICLPCARKEKYTLLIAQETSYCYFLRRWTSIVPSTEATSPLSHAKECPQKQIPQWIGNITSLMASYHKWLIFYTPYWRFGEHGLELMHHVSQPLSRTGRLRLHS